MRSPATVTDCLANASRPIPVGGGCRSIAFGCILAPSGRHRAASEESRDQVSQCGPASQVPRRAGPARHGRRAAAGAAGRGRRRPTPSWSGNCSTRPARRSMLTVATLAEAAERIAGGVDCVLLDLGLPDAQGLAGLRRLLQLRQAAGDLRAHRPRRRPPRRRRGGRGRPGLPDQGSGRRHPAGPVRPVRGRAQAGRRERPPAARGRAAAAGVGPARARPAAPAAAADHAGRRSTPSTSRAGTARSSAATSTTSCRPGRAASP